MRITDLDGPFPHDPATLQGWWVGFYQVDSNGQPLADDPQPEADFAPDDITGRAEWITLTLAALGSA